MIGRSDVDVPALDRLTVTRMAGRQWSSAAENPRQVARRLRRDVLRDEDRGGQIRRQSAHEQGERLDAADGRPGDDNVMRVAGRARPMRGPILIFRDCLRCPICCDICHARLAMPSPPASALVTHRRVTADHSSHGVAGCGPLARH